MWPKTAIKQINKQTNNSFCWENCGCTNRALSAKKYSFVWNVVSNYIHLKFVPGCIGTFQMDFSFKKTCLDFSELIIE